MKRTEIKIALLLLYTIVTSYNLVSQEPIVKSGDSWNYFDEGYLEDNWVENLNLFTWKEGVTPLGYGDDQVKTEISFGSDKNRKEFIEYFKKDIYISNNSFIGYEFRLLRDDGAIVYVNGRELYRSNMQKSTISKNIRPIRVVSSSQETIFHVNVFDSDIFREGKNTIAIAVYQANENSSDLIFDFELIGHSSSKVLEELITEKDNVNRDLQYKLSELNSKFQLEQLNNQNEVLKYSNSNLKTFLFIISILFIVAIISIYYLLENFRRKLNTLKERLDNKSEESISKDKELILSSTKLLNYKQLFKELKLDIKSIETSDKSSIKAIISEIDGILSNDDEWKTLKNHFNEVYSGFYNRLLELHPELSESDLRHCMFIKLHMQTKEISRILLIDPRSVQTTRYRIKKKMNLTEDTDLREYLLKI